MLKNASAVIVGASSLVGKELAQALSSSDRIAWDLTLLDAGVGFESGAGARFSSAGDEAVLVQPIAADAFAGKDVVFFVDDAALTEKHGPDAIRAGAAVVDLTGALSGRPGVATRAPGLSAARGADERVVVPAHPAAVMLATLLERLRSRWPDVKLAATLMVPASEYGAQAVDALQQQTTSLLTFQPLAEDVFGEQSAFNLYINPTDETKAGPAALARRVRHDVDAVAGADAARSLALQCVQAPVFYSYSCSAFASIDGTAEEMSKALTCDGIQLVTPSDASSHRNAPEDAQFAVTISEDQQSGVWLWCVCDNIKLVAHTAVACASELVVEKS